jgi:hypothetical protein
MGVDDSGPPVGVDDADLAAVAKELVSTPDVLATRTDRFFSQVRSLVERRAQSDWPNEQAAGISVFIQTPYPRKAAEPLGAIPTADLVGTSEAILGRLFLMNSDASQGYVLPLPTASPGDLLQWLAKQSFGREPTILVYRETSLIIERADGAEAETSRNVPIRITPVAVTADELLRGLHSFHLEELLTPVVCLAGVWQKGAANKYYVDDDPERTIQLRLRTFLNGWFRGLVRAEREDTTVIGRIDVRLLVPNPQGGGLAYWAIIELKVVKSFHHSATGSPTTVSEAENAENVAEGIRQAHSFSRDRKCPPGYLEIYDMRRDKSEDICEHSVVQEQLSRLVPEPEINVRSLFGSAGDARRAGY